MINTLLATGGGLYFADTAIPLQDLLVFVNIDELAWTVAGGPGAQILEILNPTGCATYTAHFPTDT